MMFLPTCKEAAALLIAREDRALPLKDRLALRIHLAACNACPVFEKQLLILRNSLSNWRNYNQDATN
ncbi:MAG: zf-HC2 domain-containing protein [Pseudomonadota bacterium]